MSRLREALAALVSSSLLITPVWGAPSSSLGTIVYADRAHMGAAPASAGATVFGGDRLSTEQSGSIQVRAGAARLLLSGASSATLATDEATPAAILTRGSATFSTANSKAFALPIASFWIRRPLHLPLRGRAAQAAGIPAARRSKPRKASSSGTPSASQRSSPCGPFTKPSKARTALKPILDLYKLLLTRLMAINPCGFVHSIRNLRFAQVQQSAPLLQNGDDFNFNQRVHRKARDLHR